MKKTKRSKVKYPNLDPKLNLKSRQELIDFDYIHKLNEDEKKWLNQFVDEYINANFKKRKRIHKPKKITIILKSGKKRIKDAYKLDAYKRNNDRNHDLFTKAKITNSIVSLNNINTKFELIEDKLIKNIDKKLKKSN